MRILISNFLLAMLILALSIFSRCQSTSDKLDTAKENVDEAKQELKEVQQEAHAESVQAAHVAEWQAFRIEAEEMIRKNEVRITELKVKMKKPGKALDAAYARKIEALEQKNAELKASLDTYDANQNGWEAFKREFNHDMEELGKALKDLTTDNKN